MSLGDGGCPASMTTRGGERREEGVKRGGARRAREGRGGEERSEKRGERGEGRRKRREDTSNHDKCAIGGGERGSKRPKE